MPRFTRFSCERYRSNNLGMGWSCFGVINGGEFEMTYYDYTKKEAIAKFREHVKEHTPDAFWNVPKKR
jgi:hypothetical protein